jgi:hypothetical protein
MPSSRLQVIEPLHDLRWSGFLQRHPRASVFHSAEWLEALRRTYLCEPVALTPSLPGQNLQSALVFCRVDSWLTGRRMVSLPFSDHCDPLVETKEEFAGLLAGAEDYLAASHSRYLEVRPLMLPGDAPAGLAESERFLRHQLDLRPALELIYDRFHKDCIKRKLQRAERENLECEEGRSESLLASFYSLQVLTRKRHRLPPQPLAWFRNLIACMGDKVKIRVASKDGRAVASILTLRYKDSLVYKYGCSDQAFNRLGGMQLLMWQAIQDARNENLSDVDLGRSALDNSGLIAFKARWGAGSTNLVYRRLGPGAAGSLTTGWQAQVGKHVFGHVPVALLPLAGRLVYRHLQ